MFTLFFYEFYNFTLDLFLYQIKTHFSSFGANLNVLEKIFPIIKNRVPDVRFFIVGGNPPKEILDYHDNKNILVVGFQEDIRKIPSSCRVSIVPLRLGSGTRLKITEALSMGIPVVSTRKGAEGLDLKHEHEILIEDDPMEFAESVIRLIGDNDFVKRLSNNGRRLMETKYSWQVICGQMMNKIDQMMSDKNITSN